MLESSPGAGKTSLIIQLAAICGYTITRVNLSEHIELGDLIGTNLPSEANDKKEISFNFVFGPVSRAIINDEWLLLDELNLAS